MCLTLVVEDHKIYKRFAEVLGLILLYIHFFNPILITALQKIIIL